MAPAMPCKTCKKSKNAETRGKTNDFKLKFPCILEASESTKLRMEDSLPNYHEDSVVEKGDTSLHHHNLAHKFIPQQSQQWTRNGNNWRKFWRGT